MQSGWNRRAASSIEDTEDKRPSQEHVARVEAELKRLGKTYEFHSYDNAGHSIFAIDRPDYRPATAQEGWKSVQPTSDAAPACVGPAEARTEPWRLAATPPASR